jgi:putative FmdB family regulatory protein
MPIYQFACARCGPFDLQRPMADAAAPAACPDCEAAAVRVFLAPASKAPLAAGVRAGLAAEERSREAPAHVNGRQIGHGHHHHATGGSRPWQLSH